MDVLYFRWKEIYPDPLEIQMKTTNSAHVKTLNSTSIRRLYISFSAACLAAILVMILSQLEFGYMIPIILLIVAGLEYFFPNIFLYFITFGVFAFRKSFAILSINIHNSNIYVGELAIIVCLIFLIISLLGKKKARLPPKWYLFAPFLIIGFILAVIGTFQYGTAALRQASIVYYSLLALLVAFRIRKNDEVRVFSFFMLFAALFGQLLDLLPPSLLKLRPEMAYSTVISFSLFLMLRSGHQVLRRWWSTAILLIPAFHTIFYFRLSTLLTLIFVFSLCGFYYIHRYSRHHKSTVTPGKAALGFAFILVIAIGAGYFLAKERYEAIWAELTAVYLTLNGDTPPVNIWEHDDGSINEDENSWEIQHQQLNISIRMLMWRQAILEGLKSPLVGTGFGSKLVIEELKRKDYPYTYYKDPHNSYISVFLHMGLLGLAALALVLVPTACSAIRKCMSDIGDNCPSLAACLLSWMAMFVLGMFNVVLATHTGAIFFWILFGLTLSADSLSEQQAEVL